MFNHYRPRGLPITNHSRAAVVQSGFGSGLWLGLVLCAIMYGSLIPFDLDLRTLGWSGFTFWQRIGFAHSTVEDFLSNIVFYVPLGFAVSAYLGRRRASLVVQVVFAALLGITLSILMESLQATAHSRTASWVDVYSNAWGAIVGAILACDTIRSVIRQPFAWVGKVNSSALALISSAITLAVLLYNLFPFDFVRGLSDLEANFRHARWGLLDHRAIPAGTPPFAAIARELTGASWFVLLGFVHARLASQRYVLRRSALLSAIKSIIILACLIEFLQLFFRSHVFDSATIVLRVLAGLMGAWVSTYVVTRSLVERCKCRGLLPALLLSFVVVLQLVFLLARHFDPRWGWSAAASTTTTHWLPFNVLWHQSVASASGKIAQELAIYGSLGITFALWVGCFKNSLAHSTLSKTATTDYAAASVVGSSGMIQPCWRLAAMFVVVVAGSMELLDSLRPAGSADITTPLLAVLSVVLAARTWTLFNIKHKSIASPAASPTTSPAVPSAAPS